MSLLVFSFNGLCAMEEDPRDIFPYNKLPLECDCKVLEYLPQDSFDIAPEKAALDVADYPVDDPVSLVDNPVSLVQHYLLKRRVVIWSPDGTRLAFGGYKKIKIIDIATGKIQNEFDHDAGVCYLKWTEDDYIVSGGSDDKLRFFDLIMDKKVGEKKCVMSKTVNPTDISPDGRIVAHGFLDKIIWSSCMSNDMSHEEFMEKWNRQDPINPDGHENIQAICWSPSGRYVAAGGLWGSINILDVATDQISVVQEDGILRKPCYALAWSPDSTQLAFSNGENVEIKNIKPFLLSICRNKYTTLAQYHLLKRIKENILGEEESLIVGKSGREALEQMPDLKKLLHIEINKAETKLWRLGLKKLKCPDKSWGKWLRETVQVADNGYINGCIIS